MAMNQQKRSHLTLHALPSSTKQEQAAVHSVAVVSKRGDSGVKNPAMLRELTKHHLESKVPASPGLRPGTGTAQQQQQQEQITLSIVLLAILMAPRTPKTRAAVAGKTRPEAERRRKNVQSDATREEQKYVSFPTPCSVAEECFSHHAPGILRRARNRLAQKAIRERTTAHIRHLEHQLAVAQRSKDADYGQELLEENAKLRGGLRETRKKLFSIAETVTSLADNLGPLLHLDTNALTAELDVLVAPQNSGSPETRSPSCDNSVVAVEAATSISTIEFPGSPVDVNEVRGELTISMGDDGPPHDHESAPVWTDSIIDTNALSSGYNALGSFECRQTQALFPSSGPLASIGGTSGVAGEPTDIPENELDLTSNFLNLNNPSWPNFESFPYSYPQGPLRRYSHSQFSDHLDFILKLLRQNGYTERHGSSPPTVVVSILREFVEQSWPAMGPWFAITDAYDIIKNIFWWRLAKSSQALRTIQASYIPTWIQQTLQYPSIIDWIPYPRIRDRLILNLEAYDIDQVICDMTEAYIIERINPLGNTPQSCSLLDLVQWSLHAAMDFFNSNPLSGTSSITRDAWCKKLIVDRATANFYSQLPKPFHIPGFKIHPNFFERYPSLYDPSAVAENTANIATSSLRLQRAIPLSQKIADSYIKVLIQAKGVTEL
ncbi:hypothetical protein B7463_g3054, partial [Scytalidium lignicola]